MPVDEGYISVHLEDGTGLGKEITPALLISLRSEAGHSSLILTRILAVYLQAPDIDLLEFIKIGRQPFEVEHDVVRMLGNVGATNHRLVACRQGRRHSQDPLGVSPYPSHL